MSKSENFSLNGNGGNGFFIPMRYVIAFGHGSVFGKRSLSSKQEEARMPMSVNKMVVETKAQNVCESRGSYIVNQINQVTDELRHTLENFLFEDHIFWIQMNFSFAP